MSGNVDALLIRGLADNYGFASPKVPEVRAQAARRGYPIVFNNGDPFAGDGKQLHTVQTRRNSLAHGSVIFAEVGRDFSHEQMVAMKCEAVCYLATLLQNIADYLSQRGYRRPTI